MFVCQTQTAAEKPISINTQKPFPEFKELSFLLKHYLFVIQIKSKIRRTKATGLQ